MEVGVLILIEGSGWQHGAGDWSQAVQKTCGFRNHLVLPELLEIPH